MAQGILATWTLVGNKFLKNHGPLLLTATVDRTVWTSVVITDADGNVVADGPSKRCTYGRAPEKKKDSEHEGYDVLHIPKGAIKLGERKFLIPQEPSKRKIHTDPPKDAEGIRVATIRAMRQIILKHFRKELTQVLTARYGKKSKKKKSKPNVPLFTEDYMTISLTIETMADMEMVLSGDISDYPPEKVTLGSE